MPSAASAHRNRNFALLALARAISTFGTALAPVALAFAVIELGGTTSDLGIVLSATLAPQVAFLLVGGVWADRLPRHYVMVGSDLASAVAQAVMAGLLLSGHAAIWHLAILGAIRGTASAFFFPASTGAVPQTVPVDQLQRANAILRMSTNTATVTGGGIGGIVVAAAGPGIAIAVDAATYGVAALLVAFINLPRAAKVAGTPFVRQLAEGWAEFRSRRWIWAIIVQFAFINAFGTGAFLVLGPFVAERSLGGPAAWGAIVAAQSLGMGRRSVGRPTFPPWTSAADSDPLRVPLRRAAGVARRARAGCTHRRGCSRGRLRPRALHDLLGHGAAAPRP